MKKWEHALYISENSGPKPVNPEDKHGHNRKHHPGLLLACLIICLAGSVTGYGQVGIGTSTPHASAQLELNAANRGFLPTRIALTSINDLTTISSPAAGLLVYNTVTAGTSPNNVTPGYYYFNGTKWVKFGLAAKLDDLEDARYDSIKANMGIGGGALASLTTSAQPETSIENIAIGNLALNKTTTGSANLAIGKVSMLWNTTGSWNVGIGQKTLFINLTGNYNTAIGHFSGSSGNYNTSVGFGALAGWGGNYNTFVGYSASSGENGPGEKNTLLGAETFIPDNDWSLITNSSAIGYGARIRASNTIQLGNDSIKYLLTSGKIKGLGYLTTGTSLTSVTDVTTIPSPDTGLMVYNKATAGASPNDVTPGYYYFNGLKWSRLTGANKLNDLDDARYDSTKGNMGLGGGALTALTPGSEPNESIENIAIGNQALNSNTTGAHNVAIGYHAMRGNLTGSWNIGIGKHVLYMNDNGKYNTAVGHYAIGGGNYNTAMGYGTLSGWGGNYNTFMGYRVNNNIVGPGERNTIIGAEASIADEAGTTVTNSSAIGSGAKIRASNTIQLGNDTVKQVLTSGKMKALGYLTTGTSLTSATDVTTIPTPDTGLVVYNKSTAGTSPDNVSPGYYYFSGAKWVRLAGATSLDELEDVRYDSSELADNMAFGGRALQNNTSGHDNLAIGHLALWKNTGGSNNLAIGKDALEYNTQGNNNMALGFMTLTQNTSGNQNIAIGNTTLTSNSTGSANTAIGYGTLFSNTTGSGNLAIGMNTLFYNSTGNYNEAVGDIALGNNTTGTKNSAFGRGALFYNNSGSYNVAIGRESLIDNTNGSYNTAIGYQSNVSSGDFTNATAIGYGAIVHASNTIQLGNNTTTDVKTAGNVTANGILLTSDARLKTNIEGIEGGLETLLRLRPYSYQKRSGFEPEYHEEREYGFLAQDIREILPELVKEGNDPDKALTVNYTALIPILTKAIQEQQMEIDELKALLKNNNGNTRKKNRKS